MTKNEKHTPKIDEISGTELTGHEWDGIKELNTPMPRWWLGLFYACIAIAIGYAVAMPAIPLLNSYTKGLLGASDRAAVHQAVKDMRTERAVYGAKLTGASLNEIQADPELFRFAMGAGKSAFGDNCATCHGSGGQGFKGYPNLNDDIWIWGGTFDDIRHTLTVGIRTAHDDTRMNLMQGYGRDELLTRPQIQDLAQYVLSLSGDAEPDAALRGANLFQSTCVSCHGPDAKGDQEQGAPNLTDSDWLYGGSADDIYTTIYNGRAGVMPNWNERLSADTISALAVYVYSLGGGIEASSVETPEEN